MNGFSKKDVISFSKKKKLHRKTINEITCIDQLENIDSIAEKALLSLLALVVSPLWKHKKEFQASVNKKEHLRVPAFSGSLKRYKYEYVSHLELIDKI